ncbi:MAG TPA: BrxE family protein [Desulfosporosinus sp.]|nr:BrxE family protein [Desulfosporosinus sp.]
MTKMANEDFLRLRFIVGYLGEQLKPNWWPSSFFAPGSKMFLTPIFSKTTVLAQYHGMREAAARVHDMRIGKGTGVFHLFRLPDAKERELHQLISNSEDMEKLINDLTSEAVAREILTSLCSNEHRQAVGPVRIGGRSDLGKIDSWREVANYYKQAFETKNQVYPYYSEEK